MKKTVDVKTVIKDLDDKNSQPSVNPDELPEGNEVRNIEEKMKPEQHSLRTQTPVCYEKYTLAPA